MLNQIIIVVGQVSSLFLMIGVGFLLGRLRIIDSSGIKTLTNTMIKVGLPCAIVRSLMVEGSPEFFRSLAAAMVVILLISFASVGVSMLMYRRQPKPQQTVLRRSKN